MPLILKHFLILEFGPYSLYLMDSVKSKSSPNLLDSAKFRIVNPYLRRPNTTEKCPVNRDKTLRAINPFIIGFLWVFMCVKTKVYNHHLDNDELGFVFKDYGLGARSSVNVLCLELWPRTVAKFNTKVILPLIVKFMHFD